jgi:hypothetical protein
MKGFVLGLLVAALAFGGYLWWSQQRTTTAVSTSADAGPTPTAKKKRRGRGAARAGSAADPGEPAPEPIRLSAADLRSTAQGDDLSRPEVVRMDLSQDQGGPAELSQDDIDQTFRAQEGAILDCIADARPDPEAYVPGRVTIKFRIQRTGTVNAVRVEAPSILQKGGLYGCVKGVVGRLRFPASGSSQIVTYPFSLS